ncbi:hypothetical protein RA281_27405 [Pseudomonas syringae pv. tagetis]
MALRVVLCGSVDELDICGFQAFLEILRNAFVQAFNARYESSKGS